MGQRTSMGTAITLIVMLVVLSGCGSGVANVNGSLLSSITVTPDAVSLNPGETQQLKAMGTYEDNTTQDITDKVTWTSSDKTKATIASTGLVTAIAVGTINITASLTWINNEAAVTVLPGEPGTGVNDAPETATPLTVPVTRQDSLYDHNGLPDVDSFSVTLDKPGQIFIGRMDAVSNYDLLDHDVIDISVAVYDAAGNAVPTGIYWPYYYFTMLGDLGMPAEYTEAVVPAGTYYLAVSSPGTQGIYHLFVDTYPWQPTNAESAPSARVGHNAVWTGDKMIVWGGSNSGGATTTGALYDPASDSWTPMSSQYAPASMQGEPAVWTGSELLIWNKNGGGRYDPATGVWTALTTSNAPTYNGQQAVWTGTEMIVAPYTPCVSVPGSQKCAPDTLVPGARFNLAQGIWTTISTTNSPACFVHQCKVHWTGNEMLLWQDINASGARYDPKTDTWASLNTENAPVSSGNAYVFWTGKEMIVWSGYDPALPVDPAHPVTRFSTGKRYDPQTDTWTTMSTVNAPTAVNTLAAVWTGRELVSWGYSIDSNGNPAYEGKGGKYDPTTNTWTAFDTRNAPQVPTLSSVIWTGSEVVIWGGSDTLLADPIAIGARWAP